LGEAEGDKETEGDKEAEGDKETEGDTETEGDKETEGDTEETEGDTEEAKCDTEETEGDTKEVGDTAEPEKPHDGHGHSVGVSTLLYRRGQAEYHGHFDCCSGEGLESQEH
jgi:hypothetical protein